MNWRIELLLWLLALGAVVSFIWQGCHYGYNISLTRNSELYSEGQGYSVVVDTSAPPGTVSHRGGKIFVSDVTQYGSGGEIAYGKGNPDSAKNGEQWFLLNTVDRYPDVELFATQPELIAALQRAGVSSPTMKSPDFWQADFSSFGPAPRLGVAVAVGLLVLLAFRARDWVSE